VQRAVRYVRLNAGRYSIDKDRIGALGASSGVHLVSMLGTQDGMGIADSQIRSSSKARRFSASSLFIQ
jgi:acetyl esterase/lipase